MTTQTEPRPRRGFYFKDTDAELLKLLVDYRFLQPEDFVRLTKRNLVSLRRRLRQLVHALYIERLTLPLEREAPLGNPPDAYVYQLAARGVARARACGFADQDYRYTREKSNLFLLHDLLVTRFHLALALATQGTERELIGWEQRRSVLLDWSEGVSGRLSVNPDAFFGVRDRAKPEGQNASYFFLEIVRSRESEYERGESNFVRKMRAFAEYYAGGRHRERYGIANFRVVTVTPTKQRAQNLCEKLREEGLGSKRFMFTDQGAIDPADSTKILGKIFLTPKDFDQGTLYSLID